MTRGHALILPLFLVIACGEPEATDPHEGHDHAGHDHGSQEHAGHDHAEDEHAGHDHAEDEHAGHDHAEDEHAGHDHAEDEHAGHDHAGHDHPLTPDPSPPGERGEEAGHDHADHADHSYIELSSAAASNIGLALHEVSTEVWYDQLKIPGTLHVDWDRRATVSTPTTVRIVSLDAPPHGTVRAGQRLAVLELVDPELRQLQIRAVEVRAELVETRIERDRTASYLEALLAKGPGVAEERRRVEADLEVLEARVTSSASTLDTILAALAMAGLSSSQLAALEQRGEPTTQISLHAPSLPGKPELEVTERGAHVGQTLDAGSPLYELAALDQLLVWGEAFEADLDAVRRAAAEDLPVSLLFPAEQRRVDGLSIRSVEGALDGEDRTTHFFVPLPNAKVGEKVVEGVRYVDREHRAGARVQVLVGTDAVGERLVIPSSALISEGGATLAYRKHGEHYEPVELTVERVESRRAIIPHGGGLEPGDQIVVTGALQVHLAHKQSEGGGGNPDPHAGHSH
jgi:cobalt-zinc-cadmium efflux system membrane fusion protein